MVNENRYGCSWGLRLCYLLMFEEQVAANQSAFVGVSDGTAIPDLMGVINGYFSTDWKENKEFMATLMAVQMKNTVLWVDARATVRIRFIGLIKQ
ncbi:hypothetical protein EV1_009173 [Malus domestica]